MIGDSTMSEYDSTRYPPIIGIAARKSIGFGNPIKIAELTTLEPRKVKM